MKEDNAEIATMEQQIAEIQDHINRLQEEQSQLDQVRYVTVIGITWHFKECSFLMTNN